MNRNKKSKLLSFIVILLILFSLIPNAKIKADDNQNSPPANSMISLVGDFFKTQSLGTDWDPKNQSSIMNEFSNGLYELTIDFKVAGNFNYKIALNGSFDINYGSDFESGGKNIALNVAIPKKVTFKVDLKNKTIYDSINNPDKFKSSATLVGTLSQSGGTDWSTTDTTYDLNYIGNGYSEKTFPMKKGDYEYKVAYDHKWSNGEIDQNIKFSLDKDEDVTFISNPDLNICTNNLISPVVSIIGDIRNKDTDNWNEKLQGFEFNQLSNTGSYVYSAFIPEGTYQYKSSLNYSWDNPIPSGTTNKSITIPIGGKYVVFVCDISGNSLYDSINDAAKVSTALGLSTAPQTVKSPVINENGTVTFSYSNDIAKEVYLAGDFTNWSANEKAMTKNQNGVWSVTLRLADAASSYEYKFIADGNYVTDPANTITSANGNSLLNVPKYSGRKIVVPGTMQQNVGGTNWDATSTQTTMTYVSNGIYALTLKNIPAGSYQYKVATDGTWTENYGAGAKLGGDNISMNVVATEDVTFWYNDDSNLIVDSTSYKKVDVKLTGTGVPDNTLLTDTTFTGIYSTKLSLKQGDYKDLVLIIDGKKEVPVGDLNITTDKIVTISYDPNTDIVFTDLSDKKINTSALYFNSKLSEYKLPYGAVPTGTNVVFNLKAAKDDLTNAYLILQTPNGTQKISMLLNGSFSDGSAKWTTNYTPSSAEMDKFYFVVSNGSDVKAYGDDDGYFGAGAPNDLGKVKLYDMNVYDKDFKTPDWFKNAVVYQIFPDRFFNGDTSNDTAQKTSRGATNYEFYNNWYSIPEDPTLEFTADGKPNLSYLGTKGDGLWSNEIYGGDLIGIQKKLNYLQSLGINTLYFNPISQSISNHRYDTTDYKNVDPILGSMDDYVSLAKEAHKRGMHIILDGVFNHVSDDSVYFDRYGKFVAKGKPIGAYQYWCRVYDLMNSETISQSDAEKKVTKDLATKGITDLHYKDWFKIANTKIAAITGDPEHYSYEGWDGYDSMPVIEALNGSEYNVTTWDNEIIDGKNADSTYWLKEGSDGWRLDAANEISDETWGHFRTAVKSQGDNVIIGEIWTDASKYLLGNMYDSVTNYRFRDPLLGFVKGTTDDNTTKYSAVDAMNALETMREQYPKEAFNAMLNIVDSHDTQRVISALDGYQKSLKAIANDPTKEALAKMKMIPLVQMTYPGAPCIYYGDEAGMPGADDPDNRRGMIWGKGNKDLVDWYATLIGIRKSNVVLATGDISPISVADSYKDDVLAYTRDNSKDHAVIAINRRTTNINSITLDTPSIPDGTVLTNALNPTEQYAVANNKVTVSIPEQSGIILLSSYKTPVLNLLGLKDIYDPSYIVPEKNTSNNGSGSGNTTGNTTTSSNTAGNSTSGNTTTGGNTASGNTTASATTTPSKQSNKTSAILPKTGSFVDTSLLIGVGVILIIGGTICLFIYKKKKRIE